MMTMRQIFRVVIFYGVAVTVCVLLLAVSKEDILTGHPKVVRVDKLDSRRTGNLTQIRASQRLFSAKIPKENISSQANATVRGDKILLTLFTTFAMKSEKKQIYKNVIMNWVSFKPYVQPLLFINQIDDDLVSIARTSGWKVLPLPRVNQQGTPYFKDMYMAAMKNSSSIFYGFSNGDILYDNGLVKTLLAVSEYSKDEKGVFVTGVRTNFKLNNRHIVSPNLVQDIARKEGKLFIPAAQDYFFMLHGKYPWYIVPDVVIGRRAYDNFIVGTAVLYNMTVIDSTKTLLALHQTGTDGNAAGWSKKNRDVNHNVKILRKFKSSFDRGTTSNIRTATRYDNNGKVTFFQKNLTVAKKAETGKQNKIVKLIRRPQILEGMAKSRLLYNLTSTFSVVNTTN